MKIMAKRIATILGIVFLLIGVIGFVAPNFLGAHLNTAHNLVHIVSGAVALYLGLAGSLSSARLFCIVFGLVYLLLGIVGFLLGTGSDRMFDVAGILHLGTMDHIIHIALGIIFLIGGLLTKAGYDAARDHD
jgi:hypothetical protein